jgi:hypothetical protein
MRLSGVRGALAPTHGRTSPFHDAVSAAGVRIFERDGAGTVGASYLFATPRDLARLHLWLRLVLERRAAPPGRVVCDSLGRARRSSRKRSNGTRASRAGPRMALASRRPARRAAGVRAGAFAALGWSQGVYVIPSEDLVIVRTGDDRDHTFSNDELLRRALAFARSLP